MNFSGLLFIGWLFTGIIPQEFAAERQLLLFGVEKYPVLGEQQKLLLKNDSAGVSDRSLVVTIVHQGDARIGKYSVSTDQFTILLIGRDNTEKYRTHSLLSAKQLFGIIDTMPMRKAEIAAKAK